MLLDTIYLGDSRDILPSLPENSIACSIWSPPYHVGKPYEANMRYEDWQALLRDVIRAHQRILQPGGFMIINIADILAFKDPRHAAHHGGEQKQQAQPCHS
jgi:site-specific DNA-methyltransferase (adenine-specific)